MDLEQVRKSVRDIPDYPKPGIMFKDVSTAYREGEVFNFIADSIYAKYKAVGITKVVGIEARGFILGAVIASKLNVGFVPIRIPG